MGETILSTVRKAARLAVYEEMMMRVKNHQTPPTILPDRDLQERSETAGLVTTQHTTPDYAHTKLSQKYLYMC